MMKFALILVLAGAVEVEVHTRSGPSTTAELSELAEASVTVTSDGQAKVIASDEITKLTFSNPRVDASGKLQLRLRNGTRLTASSIDVTNSRAKVKLAVGPVIEIPTDKIHYALLQPTNAQLDVERKEILARKPIGDIVIVRRPNQKLDYVEGLLGDVTKEAVKFQFDGDWIDVRRAKVDGIWYFRAAPPVVPTPRCRVQLSDASQMEVEKVSLDGDMLAVRTTDELDLQIPLGMIQTIEFASSKSVFLSDLQAERVAITPSLSIPALTKDLIDLGADEPWLPQSNASFFGGDALQLAGADGVVEEYTKGLAIHSRTELTYRLASEYRQFTALAGLDPATRHSGSVSLVIQGDRKELFRADVRAGMPPLEIDVDLTGANRLTILVDYGDTSDIADRLNLCDARLMK